MHVTVIIPTYNRADLIEETVDSVLQQTHCNFEIIIVDDGSTDHTRQVLERYQGKVRYLYQENKERAAARNYGIREAKGEFLAFLDSDDLWPKDHLEKSLAVLAPDPTCGLVWSDVIYIDAKGKDLCEVKLPGPTGWIFPHLLRNNYINQSSVVVRKKCFEVVGTFYEDRNLSGSEDWEMWLRIASRFTMKHVDRHYTRFRIHSANSTMINPIAAERSILLALEIVIHNPLLMDHLPQKMNLVYAEHYRKIAINYYVSGDMPKARHYFIRALKRHKPLLLIPYFWFQFGRCYLGAKTSRFFRTLKYRVLKTNLPSR